MNSAFLGFWETKLTNNPHKEGPSGVGKSQLMDYRAFSEGHKGSGLASVTVETKLLALSESRSQCSHPFSNLPHELEECIYFAIG